MKVGAPKASAVAGLVIAGIMYSMTGAEAVPNVVIDEDVVVYSGHNGRLTVVREAWAGQDREVIYDSHFSDEDEDGEINGRDKCENTPLGQPIDDGGCAKQEFCQLNLPDVVVRSSTELARFTARCKEADWRNDQPWTVAPGDCSVMTGRAGTAKTAYCR